MADGAQISAPAISGGAAASIDKYLVQFESMRADRRDFDTMNQMVSDYILPGRDFSVTQRPNQLRPHRMVSSLATNLNVRRAQYLLSYWLDTTRPFLLPNVKRGLAVAGRDSEIDDAGLDYLGKLEWNVFDHMMRPRAQLMLRGGSMLQEFSGFGNGVMWTGRKRGFGPYYNTRPVQNCWWSENEEGVIDTLFVRLTLPVYRVLQRYPNAALLPGWNEDKVKSEQTLTTILLCCQPRAGGVAGAVVENKPFEFCVVSEEKKAILNEAGFDSFPYAVYRDNPMPGSAYAKGAGHMALPDVMVLNHLMQAVENIASQRADPSIAMPARMFGKPLDRRPSAVNYYSPQALGLTRAENAIVKLDLTGDPTEAIAVMQMLRDNIEQSFFADQMRPRETGDQTAAEIGDRRDLRLSAAASTVANLAMGTCLMGDRSMEILAEEGIITAGPPSVAGAEVDWEYAGPLQIAQLRGNAQVMLQLINARALVAAQDKSAAEAMDLEEAMRTLMESLGSPTRVEVSRAKVAQMRADEARAAQQQANAAKLAQVAGAANDGAQAVSTLAGVGQQGAPGPAQGGGAAPFAPAAPFASEIAA